MTEEPKRPEGAIYEVRIYRRGQRNVWFTAQVPGPRVEDAKAQALEQLKSFPQDPNDYDLDTIEAPI